MILRTKNDHFCESRKNKNNPLHLAVRCAWNFLAIKFYPSLKRGAAGHGGPWWEPISSLAFGVTSGGRAPLRRDLTGESWLPTATPGSLRRPRPDPGRYAPLVVSGALVFPAFSFFLNNKLFH